MGSSIGRLIKFAQTTIKATPNVGELLGTSKSGIEVYQKVAKDGAQVLTSYKNGTLIKEITKEAQEVSNEGSSHFNTIIKNYGKDEYTAITTHADKKGTITSVHSSTKAWNGKDDVNSLSNKPFKRYIAQFVKDKKLTGYYKLENGRYTDVVYSDYYTTTRKHGSMTFPNGQVHDYRYEKFEPKPATNGKGPLAFFKRFGSQGIEVTDKGVKPLSLWNFSNGPEYFKTH